LAFHEAKHTALNTLAKQVAGGVMSNHSVANS